MDSVKTRVLNILGSGKVSDQVWTILDRILRGHMIEQQQEEDGAEKL